MCGIVGVASAYTNGFSSAEADMFDSMLFVDTMRGWDSTGAFVVDKHANVSIAKEASEGPKFLRTPEYKKLRGEAVWKGIFMVGHNRAATRGSVSDENAHPFWVDDKIVLVQNGTYNGSHKHHKDTAVDTDAIAHVIAEEDDIEKALQKIDAAYALVWFNAETKQLNMIRNTQRPLFLAHSKDMRAMYWASERDTILWAAGRTKQELHGDPYMLEEGMLAQLSIQDSSWGVEYKKLNYRFQQQHAPKSSVFHGVNFGSNGFRSRSPNYSPWPDDSSLACAYNSADEDGWGNIGNGSRSVAQNSSEYRRRGLVAADDVQFPFVEIIVNKYKHALADPVDTRDAVERFAEQRRSADKNGGLVVELVDIEPANENAHCTTWWAYGHALDATGEKHKADVVVYWLVHNKTHSEAISYVTDYMYRVNVRAPTVRQMSDVAGRTRTYACVFGSDITSIPLIGSEAGKEKTDAA